MIDYYSILAIFQSTIDLFWTSYEVKDSQKTWRLRFWPTMAVFGGILSLIALGSEILLKIIEVINTPIGSIGLTVLSHFPILGAVGVAILTALSIKTIYETIKSDDMGLMKKIEMLIIGSLKLLSQIALLGLTIALLAFPPTGMAITAALLSICIVGAALSLYEHYKFKEQTFKNELPARPTSLLDPIPKPHERGLTAHQTPVYHKQENQEDILSNTNATNRESIK